MYAVTIDNGLHLTNRERDILTFLGEGKSSKEIAGILRLSVRTVGSHRRSICRKLHAHSTAELVQKAGLLTQIVATVVSLYPHNNPPN